MEFLKLHKGHITDLLKTREGSHTRKEKSKNIQYIRKTDKDSGNTGYNTW